MRRIVLVVLLLVTGWVLAGPGVWTSGGPYGGIVNKLVFDPVAPTTIYASANGSFFKTLNRGSSWSRAQAGIAGFVGNLFVVDADAPNTLYLFDSTNRLYRSVDGAANWALTGYAVPADFQVTGIADVPGSTGQLLIALAVSTDANGFPLPVAGSRLLLSVDAGNTFTPRDSGLPVGLDLASIAVDPSDPNRMRS
ncbi:MAG: WD40/YVTN/BNR-like repeat-containing protein, partial [Lysobacterales bacterium]